MIFQASEFGSYNRWDSTKDYKSASPSICSQICRLAIRRPHNTFVSCYALHLLLHIVSWICAPVVASATSMTLAHQSRSCHLHQKTFTYAMLLALHLAAATLHRRLQPTNL